MMRYIQHSEKRNKSDMQCVMCCWYRRGRSVDVDPCRVRLAIDSSYDSMWRTVISLLPTPSFTYSVDTRLFGFSRVLLVRLIPEPGHAQRWTPCCCKKRLFQHRRTIHILCHLVPMKLLILSFLLPRPINCPFCG